MIAEISPHEVYEKVIEIREDLEFSRILILFLFAMVALQVLSRLVVTKRVLAALNRSALNEERVARLLDIVERHGTATDKRADEVAEGAEQVIAELRVIITELKVDKSGNP